MRLNQVAFLCAMAGAMSPLYAQEISQGPHPDLQTIRAILEAPNNNIDLARAKLTIDRIIDPSVDIEKNLKKLDAMVKNINAMAPANATSLQKMETLVQYLYKAGPWNGSHPYQYDLNDPFGNDIRNKLLPTYLATKRGNCISMPFLFIVLGQKLGIDVTASTVPEHVFVKYRLDDGQFRNFEATSGGPKLDASYQRDIPMTNEALANGIYMRPLTKKETVVEMAGTLLEFYGQQGLQDQRIALADLMLGYNPKNVSAILHKGAAYHRLAQRDFMSKYPTSDNIPSEKRAYFNDLIRNHNLWFSRAEELGWREPKAAARANYIQSVQRARPAQQ